MNAPVPPGQHLDDDRLSALVDGETDPVADAHLAGCGACGDRCRALRSVAASVAASPDANTRHGLDGALAAARQAWMTERAAAVAPGTTAIRPSPARADRGRGRMLGVAAASAALLGAVALATSLGGGGPDRATNLASAPPTDAGRAQDTVAAEGPAAATPMANDRAAAEAGPQIAAAPGGAPGGPGVADLGDQFELAVVADLARQRLAATAADAGSQTEMLTAAPATPPCAGPAADAAGAASTGASFAATLRFRGSPAVLHVFDGVAPAPDGAGRARVVVMTTAGCALLGVADL